VKGSSVLSLLNKEAEDTFCSPPFEVYMQLCHMRQQRRKVKNVAFISGFLLIINE